jgi:hypothetical protein
VSVLCPASINTNIHEATLTRPKHLENTGYLVDDRSITALRAIYDLGMDPVDLARWLKKGIEDEQLYIIPYPEEREALERHFQAILDSVLPVEADPEGYKKRTEGMKALREQAIVEARRHPKKPMEPGFGKADPSLDWVKPMEMGPPPAPPSEGE